MKKLFVIGVFVFTAGGAAAQKPPAHFPGSKGSRAGEYAAMTAAWKERQAAAAPSGAVVVRQPVAIPVSAQAQPGIPAALRKGDEVPPPTPAAVSKEIDDLDAKIRTGLADLQKSITELEKDQKSWAALDKTLHTARKVNGALQSNCDGMLKVYDAKIGPALAGLKVKLEAAPAVYRKLAADRRTKAGAAAFPTERDSYQSMAEFCESAAVLCERRYREVFAAPDPRTLSAADSLAESMGRVRRMSAVHAAWAETLDAWPSVLNDPKLGEMVDQLNAYCTDLIAQQQGMAKLTTILKATAAEGKK